MRDREKEEVRDREKVEEMRHFKGVLKLKRDDPYTTGKNYKP